MYANCSAERQEGLRLKKLIVAFLLLREGWADYKPKPSDIERPMELVKTGSISGIHLESVNGEIEQRDTDSGVWVDRDIIPKVLTVQNRLLIDMFLKCKLFGNPVAFPFSGGWAEQPCQIVDVIETLLVAEKMKNGNN